MIPPPQARHPEAPAIPDGVAFAPVPLYRNPPQQQPPTPAPPAAPPVRAIAAGLAVMSALLLGVGWRIHEAAYIAGAADAQAEIGQLESQAAATNARIQSFCQGG